MFTNTPKDEWFASLLHTFFLFLDTSVSIYAVHV